jgi:hypothetical protein
MALSKLWVAAFTNKEGIGEGNGRRRTIAETGW